MGDKSCRRELEGMIEAGNLRGILARAGELHGHLCGFVGYGVLAGCHGLMRLGVLGHRGMEDVVAIVETNSCFSDGVQVATGCTFGNNCLIYRDYGKTAVTLATRNGRAVRLALDPDFQESVFRQHPEAGALFQKLVGRREPGTAEERQRLMEQFEAIAFSALDLPPETVFRIREGTIQVPDYAPIFASVRCRACGENVMEPKARARDGGHLCIPCAGSPYAELNGGGIFQVPGQGGDG